MATKRAQLSTLIQNDMANRDFENSNTATANAGGGPAPSRSLKQKTPKEAVKIRLDAGEWELLQDIAERQGTKASILIRQAVKEIIRKSGGGF